MPPKRARTHYNAGGVLRPCFVRSEALHRTRLYSEGAMIAVRRRGEESRRRISEALAEVTKGVTHDVLLPNLHVTKSGWWF